MSGIGPSPPGALFWGAGHIGIRLEHRREAVSWND